MTDYQTSSSSDGFTQAPYVSFESLKEENFHLKRQMKLIEGEHARIKAFLEQKIELLEAQITHYQEREANMKKINQKILDTLEDMNNNEAKNGLKIIAIDELEKANQQYNKAVFDIKTRMNQELARFAKENKLLKESVIEKDKQLKALKTLVEEMENRYANMVPSSINTNVSILEIEDKEWRFRRERSHSNFNRAKTVESISLVKEVLHSEPKQYEEKDEASPKFYQESDHAPAPSTNGNFEKMSFTELDFSDNRCSWGNLPTFKEQNGNNLLNAIGQENNYLHGRALSSIRPEMEPFSAENDNESRSERQFQKPNHAFSISTFMSNSDFLRTAPNEQSTVLDTAGLQTAEEKIKFFEREQPFCEPRNSEVIISMGDILGFGDSQAPKVQSFEKEQNLSRLEDSRSYGTLQNPFYFGTPIGTPREEEESKRNSSWSKSKSRSHYVQGLHARKYAQTSLQKRYNISERNIIEDEEDDTSHNSEIQSMMKRLLKVKDKVEKQNVELNASRSALGWDQPCSSFSSYSLAKHSISEPVYANSQTGRKSKSPNVTLIENDGRVLNGLFRENIPKNGYGANFVIKH